VLTDKGMAFEGLAFGEGCLKGAESHLEWPF